MKSTVIISSDEQFKRALGDFIARGGHVVEAASDLEGALKLLHEAETRLFIVDTNVKNFTRVISELRTRRPMLPLLVIFDVLGDHRHLDELNWERDQLLIRPFRGEELSSKISDALAWGGPQRFIKFGDLVIDLGRELVTVKDKVLSLGRKEREILTILAHRAGKVISAQRMLAVTRDECYGEHLISLKRKLKLVAGHTLQIRTYYGGGYRLEGQG